MRSIEHVLLELPYPEEDPTQLTVLIGENGSGKSTILEALEIVRRAADSEDFLDAFHQIHGGLFDVLRRGASALEIEVGIGVDQAECFYKLEIGIGASGHAELREVVRDSWTTELSRVGPQLDDAIRPGKLDPSQSIISRFRDALGAFDSTVRMHRALKNIELHVPFEVTPRWLARAHRRSDELRQAIRLMPVRQLDRLGANLANVFHELRNQPDWHKTIEIVRMGLGPDVDTVVLNADPGGGAHALSLRLRGSDVTLPTSALSDGQLAYLCYVALFRFKRPERSLLAFDEPELHLHPQLLTRVVQYFEEMSENHPVLLATHSDRLLDALSDPASTVVVCDLGGPNGSTRLRRLDPEAYQHWVDDYRGVGELRDAGYLGHILRDAQAPGSASPEPMTPGTETHTPRSHEPAR